MEALCTSVIPLCVIAHELQCIHHAGRPTPNHVSRVCYCSSWRGRHLQLNEFLLLVPGGRSDFSCPDAAAEAAKWHAEARAFSSEVQRVENLQADAVKAREAEREGWRDFTSETARLRERQHVDGASNVRRDLQRELADVRDALTRAERESEDLLEGGSLARRSLDEAGARLSSLRQVAAQVEREAGL